MTPQIDIKVTEGVKPAAAAKAEIGRIPCPRLRVLITGARGQIGGTLGRRLQSAGHYVYALGADIRDFTALRDEMALRATAAEPIIVVNAAALVGTITCDIAGNEAYATNVDGAEHVYLAAAEIGASMVYHLSTTAIYDPLAPRPYQEASPIRPHTRYGHTKAEAERVLMRRFEARAEVGLTIIRPCFCYGGAEDRVSTVKGLVDAARANRPYIVQLARGNFKDWLHIDDFAEDFFNLIEVQHLRRANYGVYNIARGAPLTFDEVVTFLKGHNLWPRYVVERPSDDYLGDHIVNANAIRRYLDPSGTTAPREYKTLDTWLREYLGAAYDRR